MFTFKYFPPEETAISPFGLAETQFRAAETGELPPGDRSLYFPYIQILPFECSLDEKPVTFTIVGWNKLTIKAGVK